MFGAVLGDILGSKYEGALFQTPPDDLRQANCNFTDDSVLTCAIADALINEHNPCTSLRNWWLRYPNRHYGGWFSGWCTHEGTKAYGSYGNGGAMRVSPVALFADDLVQTEELATTVTGVTHSHPEGMRGALVLAKAIRMALDGKSASFIRGQLLKSNYPYAQTVEECVRHQVFDLSAQGSVPKAIAAALEADCYETTIRNAIRIGGDTDTIACMAGGLAEALYGIPPSLGEWGWEKLPPEMQDTLTELYRKSGFDGVSFQGIEECHAIRNRKRPGILGNLKEAMASLFG